jgi:hypothetical protein
MKLHLLTAEDPLTLNARARELIRMPKLPMPLLVAQTPSPWRVAHSDEFTRDVDTSPARRPPIVMLPTG